MELLPDSGTAADPREMMQRFLDVVPHAEALGMRVIDAGPGMVELEMPWRAEFVGDPATGVLHGGVVSALMDTCCGGAVLVHPNRPATTATIDLRIDYLRSAAPGQAVRTRAECFHMARAVAFVRAVAHDGTDGPPVATATGSFTVEWQR